MQGEEASSVHAFSVDPIMSQRPSTLGGIAASILDANLPAGDAPILARRKSVTRILEEAKAEEREAAAVVRAKRALGERAHHASASHDDPVLETMLRKVATRGVVAIFNAVRTAQKEQPAADIEFDGRGRAKRRRAGDPDPSLPSGAVAAAAQSRESFLDVLRRGSSASSAAMAAPKQRAPVETAGSANAGGAGFLRDDFLLGRKRAKDWDRDENEDEEDIVDDARGADDDDDDDDE